MAPTIKKYFINIIFLVSPVTLSLYAQSATENPVSSVNATCETASTCNQKNDIADERIISELENSNQFIVGLSIPKDSLSMAADKNDQTTSECEENSVLLASYSALAKDIIENYKYDFSETFIDILFFEDIDLARKRTI